MRNYVFGDLRIEVSDPAATGSPVCVNWFGKSSHASPEVLLTPVFTEIMAVAVRFNAPVEMHFEELEFFNSSTIAVIIKFVKNFIAKKIRLVAIYNSDHRWQKIFFDALWVFEKEDGLLKIKSVPRASERQMPSGKVPGGKL